MFSNFGGEKGENVKIDHRVINCKMFIRAVISESCERKFCAFAAECVIDNETGKATCRCITHCDVIVTSEVTSSEAVCGSDNATYSSECQLRAVSCRQRRRIRVLWRGTCGL